MGDILIINDKKFLFVSLGENVVNKKKRKKMTSPGMETAHRVAIIALLITAVVATAGVFFIGSNCKATDPACAPAVSPVYYGEGATNTYSTCGCNTSAEIRNETNARVLSNTEFGSGDASLEDARGVSAFTVFFTEFIFNDIFRPVYHPDYTSSIPVPPGDPVFSASHITFRVPVSPYTHTFPPNCPFPLNNGTAYIDLSNVYGSSESGELARLRTHSLGRMRMVAEDESRLLERNATTGKWTIADVRDTYNAGVLALHTLAVRNHNYWADRLLSFHHTWTDEQLFWKARQLNIAEWQRIVYHEWLPTLLFIHGVTPDPESPVPNTLTEPRVTMEEALALMPAMVDTMFPSWVNRGDGAPIPYAEFTGRSGQDLISTHNIETFLGSCVKTRARRFDGNIISERRNQGNATAPRDLVAIHVQRGRLARILDWHAMYQCIQGAPFPADTRDAYQGFIEEEIYPGTSVGHTTVRALANLFYRVRDADQAYYTYNAAAIGPAYWETINHATMGTLLVRNGRGPYNALNIQHPFVVVDMFH